MVDVAGRGNWRADASVDRPDDLKDPLTFSDQRLHSIAGTNLCRRLCGIPVDANVSAIAKLRCERTRLDESDCAQPPVNPSLGRRPVFGHGIADACVARLRTRSARSAGIPGPGRAWMSTRSSTLRWARFRMGSSSVRSPVRSLRLHSGPDRGASSRQLEVMHQLAEGVAPHV